MGVTERVVPGILERLRADSGEAVAA
jgi:hypothetical protein